MRVVVASTNPVKIDSVRSGYTYMFGRPPVDLQTIAIEPQATDQPVGDEETYSGALHRALQARERLPNANLWVGQEGGVVDFNGTLFAFDWVVVVGRSGAIGKGRTISYPLPLAVADMVQQGLELSHACDRVFGTQQRAKIGYREGSSGYLTNGALPRTLCCEQAVILALVPFAQPDFCFNSSNSAARKGGAL